MAVVPRILITPGEPAGIGPDILIQAAQKKGSAELIAIGSPDLLLERARQLKLPLKLNEFNEGINAPSLPGTLSIIPVSLSAPSQPGILNAANAPYVLKTLQIAADHCLAKKAHALVTGPVNKAGIQSADPFFTGHTEFFANYCGVPSVVMLFVAATFKVALATTHLPLSQVSAAINSQKLTQTLLLLYTELKKYFNITHPKILVCGLNPHAGENGLLGREEIDVITPAIQEACHLGVNAEGPLSADTLFTEKYLSKADAILAMYHDQALPVVKALSFGHAVNMTLGLPFPRTSVDHGTALDIAGTGQADPQSLIAAIELACSV